MECSTVYCDTDDGIIILLDERTPVARKSHICGECRRTINAGEKYNLEVGVYDGQFCREKTCLDCMSIRKEFFKDGFLYGETKWMLRDYIRKSHGDISESCIIRLTPRARDMVCDFINECFDGNDEEDDE